MTSRSRVWIFTSIAQCFIVLLRKMHEEFLAGWLGLFQPFTRSDTLVEFLAFAKSFERWSSGSIRRKGLFSLSFAKWKAAVVAAGVVVAVAAAGVVVVVAANVNLNVRADVERQKLRESLVVESHNETFYCQHLLLWEAKWSLLSTI